jgi:FkbH-like protein
MNEKKLYEIIAKNREFEKVYSDIKEINISIISNITCDPIKEVLEYCLRKSGLNACVTIGAYNNIIQNCANIKTENILIVFWELCDYFPGFYYKVNILEQEETEKIIEKFKSDIDLFFSINKDRSLILFNKFSSLIFNNHYLIDNNFDKICNALNDYLAKKCTNNTIFINIEKIIAQISIEKSVDFRYYYSFKSLYTIDFYKHYSFHIKPIINCVNGKTKKVLIFDCDNTLWKGIVGEDGIEKIEMSEKTKMGAIYEEIQYLALDLNKKGVILALCSKNNPEDVITVLEKHPDIILKEKNFSITAINWNDKVSNLKTIAKNLNLGLDSFIFIDDSEFEVNYVQQKLPEVTVIQVPKKIAEYPKIFRKNMNKFFSINITTEDKTKIQQYQQQIERENEKQIFNNLEDYLKSLGLIVEISIDNTKFIPRIAQLTQKTNQFNLTTRRYTEKEIEKFIKNPNVKVFSFRVLDRFGDYGITGVCIIFFNLITNSAEVDTFLISCRIIGRNIEFCFYDFLIQYLSQKNIKKVYSYYLRTEKNSQVKNFFDSLNFKPIYRSDEETQYELIIDQYSPVNINYIKTTY